MIVCLCKGVSSGMILDHVRRGNRSLKAIARACEAGTSCGACVHQIRELVELTGAVGHRSRHESAEPTAGDPTA